MTVGLLLTALALGIRHGVDWDHVAAIADLSGSAASRRRGFVLSLLYALGHAAVVLALGAAAIALGTTIPDGLDQWMGRVVGVTLVGLGVWVIVGLVRHRRDFRLRSRWILILGGTFAGLRRVRRARASRSIAVMHDHEHPHDDEPHAAAYSHDHSHRPEPAVELSPSGTDPGGLISPMVGPGSASSPGRVHRHAHRHDLVLPGRATAGYGNGAAAGIGMLHGVGVESPTQIAVFVASTSVVGAAGGVLLLLAWIVGLVVANSVLALAAGAGLLHAEQNFTIYATLAVVVAALSIVMGVSFIAGFEALPAIGG